MCSTPEQEWYFDAARNRWVFSVTPQLQGIVSEEDGKWLGQEVSSFSPKAVGYHHRVSCGTRKWAQEVVLSELCNTWGPLKPLGLLNESVLTWWPQRISHWKSVFSGYTYLLDFSPSERSREEGAAYYAYAKPTSKIGAYRPIVLGASSEVSSTEEVPPTDIRTALQRIEKHIARHNPLLYMSYRLGEEYGT